MDKSAYPDDWPNLSRFIREANNWQCQQCGVQCRRPGEFDLGWQYQLTVAHWDHEYYTPEVFCVALCVPCHFRHDAGHSWVARRRWERLRRQLAGQLGWGVDADGSRIACEMWYNDEVASP